MKNFLSIIFAFIKVNRNVCLGVFLFVVTFSCKLEKIPPPGINDDIECLNTVEGYVKDSKNNHGISGCRVVINNKVLFTNSEGYYRYEGVDKIVSEVVTASFEGFVSQSKLLAGNQIESNCNVNLGVGFFLTKISNSIVVNNQSQSILLDEGVKLFVPRNAVKKETEIKITQLNDKHSMGNYDSPILPINKFILEPAGLILDHPIELTFKNIYQDLNHEKLKCFSLNKSTSNWEPDNNSFATYGNDKKDVVIKVAKLGIISIGLDSIVKDVVHKDYWITRSEDTLDLKCCNCKSICRKKVKHKLKPKTEKIGGGNINLNKLCLATGHINVNGDPMIFAPEQNFSIGKCKTKIVLYNTFVKETTGTVIATNEPFIITSFTDLRGPFVNPETNGCFNYPNSKCHQGCPE